MKTRTYPLFLDRDEFFLNVMDPGGDTGLSLFSIRKDAFKLVEWATIAYRPRAGDMPTATLIEWHLNYPGLHYFLYEDFHLRNTEEAASTDLTALRVLGAVEQVLYDRDLYVAVFKQEPVDMRMATDEKLEKLGLHMGHQHAQRHVRDANRHAVTFLADGGYLPVCQVAFPRRGVRSPSVPADSHP